MEIYNNHPFLEAIQSQLVNFNDYYVENWHSKIRANTSPQYSAEAITLQALCIPAGYHTQKPPSYNKCDYCYSNFENNYDQDAINVNILEKENLNELLNEVEESCITGVEDKEVEEDITEEQIIALDFRNAFDLIKDW
ncbi:2394_t:CDS:2 [Entrophospora sp. SA101]|nr:2394_t:CDS:2 [Entrophospora sp. SA101]